MTYLAHSARDGRPAQTYRDHVVGVLKKAERYASEAGYYCKKSGEALLPVVRAGALLHDLGKLDEENQAVLHQEDGRKHLPVDHVDAGSAALKAKDSVYAALLVYSHHAGLPDMPSEYLRGEIAFLRDEHGSVRARTDASLEELLSRHRAACGFEDVPKAKREGMFSPVFTRMALSCFADADHTDTAQAYGNAPLAEKEISLRAKERLAALDAYVSRLGGEDERSLLRREMYRSCRDAEETGSFVACDSPVGSGKTTAVMAHLLHQAERRELRRIFIVLPYTSIIRQSVDVYRKALVLPGEKPEEVVAELHCRADFQNVETRYLTSLWRAPIVVTTAVTFFETLASAHPAALRRLHELPGSAIFLDEAHNALPIKLLPLAWKWMNVLAEEWSCYWVLASGSLVRYWQLSALDEIDMPHPNVPDLVDAELRGRLMKYEKDRISFCEKQSSLSRRELVEWVRAFPGPRLLIVNTVQTAAVLADEFDRSYGRACVEHLSTALTPEDREKTIERIKARLRDKEDDDWTLVATSCVEAGVDFSFRTGFRELSSLLSLLQAAGRVNRHGSEKEALMWTFTLKDDQMLKSNPLVETARKVLSGYFRKGLAISPELSSRSMNDEIIRDDSCLASIEKMMAFENANEFPCVENKFKVIDEDTVFAVVDEGLAEDISHGGGDWRELQKKSVSIFRKKIAALHLQEISGGVYRWTLPYDDFLGYMRGVLDSERIRADFLSH